LAIDEPQGALSDLVARELIQITRESLSNVVRHACASIAWVRLEWSAEDVKLTIADDGRGFSSGATTGGRGLSNMRYRAGGLGGAMRVAPRAAESTSVNVTAPLREYQKACLTHRECR
jgi:signal transduction histidine kinase